jgi:hypothetical protein
MKSVLVDSSVLLDIFEDDRHWYAWSAATLNAYADAHHLCINPVIYSEISVGFKEIETLEKAVMACGLKLLEIPREALFLAGKAFLNYRRQKGNKLILLPDFFIGAHAAVIGTPLITRDVKRIRHYFPSVNIISPGQSKH